MTEEIRLSFNRLHPAQKDIRDNCVRYNVCCLGRRTGKTVLGLDTLIVADRGALDGFPVGWFAPSYKYLDEVFRSAKHQLSAVIRRIDSQQHRIELVTGGCIDFWSMDNDDPARGRKYSIVVIDEAAMVKRLESVWNLAIRPTLIDYAGSAWFLSTPKGINDFHTLYKRGLPESETYDPDWRSWQMPSSVNPHLDPAELETAREESPKLVFKQEYLAEFVDFGGTAITREWLQYGQPPDVKSLTITIGVDLALSVKETADYTAAVVMGREKAGMLWVLDVQRIRAPFHQVMQFIQQMAEKWRPSLVSIEEIQFQSAVIQELLRTTSLPVRGVKPDRDKLTRFQPLQARYEQRLVYHAVGLPGCFEDEMLSFPVGAHDDMVDALVYAFNGLSTCGKIEFHTAGSRVSMHAKDNY